MLFTKIYNVGAEAEKDWTAKANELGLIEEPALKSLSPQVKTSYSNQSKKQKREKKPIGEKDEKFKKDKTPGSCALSDEIVSKTSLQDKPRKNQSNFAKIKAGGSVVIIEGNNYGSLFLPPSDLPLPRQFAQSTLDVESPQIAYFDKEKKEAPTLKSYSPGMFIGAGCFPHGISPTNVKINNRAGEDDSLDLPQNETVPKIWNLSAENNYFTGREKRLSKLRKHFEEKNSYQSRKEIIHVTYGPGGTGKTQLLKKYAHESKSLYDIVFWFDASGNLDAQFKVFAEELKQRFGFNIITEGVEPAKICKAVKDTLRSCDLHWLLLFDNASDPEKLKKFLPQQHAKKRGHIMINSRNPQWGAYPHSRLKPFMPEEAVLYIQKRLKGIKVAKAIELAEFSGNIPLALAQALMLITECPSINGINGYIEMLQNEKEKVRKLEEDLLNRRRKVWKEESEEIELPLDEGNITVTAAINISIKQIQTLLGFELLFFTSFLDCSSIPLFLLKEWCFKRGYDLNRDFDFSINELTRGALLELDQKEHEDANYSIHELLQEVSGKIVSDNEHITDNRNQLLVTLLAVINDNFTYNKYRKESFAKSKILFPHAIKIAEYAVKNRIELKATTTLLARLRDYYLYYLGDYHAALEYAEKAIELSKIVYEEVVQDDLTKIENQILLAKATHGCGTVLRRHQKFDNAKGIFEKALMMKLDIYQTREHPDIAKTIHSIADMDYSLGNYELSLHGFEEALAIERKNYMLGDPNYQLIGVTLHGVGNVLIKQKKYSLAVEKFREAVKIKAEAFKDMLDHPDLAVTIRALASGLCYLGKEEEEKGHSREARILFEEAVKNFEQVLLIQERNYPNKHHPQIAETHTRFAEMHVQAGNKEEAMVHYKKAYNIFQQVLGAENSKTISCHSALQNLCRETSMIKSDAKGMYLNKG
jgi:tetratricopeptide (TPR) repeat protein